MKKTLFLIFSIAFCIAVSAQPYTSKDFKDVKAKMSNTTVCDNNDKIHHLPSQRPTLHVPRNSDGLVEIGATHYLTVTTANARNTINWSPDGKSCTTTWTIGSEPTNGSGILGTGINYFDNVTQEWGPAPSLNPLERVEQFPLNKTHAPGWGSHVFTAEGECVISHSTADGGMVINYRETKGEGEWIQYILQGPELSNGKTEILYPTTFAVGDTIHLVCVTGSSATYHDYLMYPLYYRSIDGGKTWEEFKTFEDVMTEQDLLESGADRYVITARGNHVVIAYINGSAAYLESRDGGDTWERHSVYDTEWSSSSTGVWVGPTMYATTIGVAIGDDDKVHIAFSAQMRHREPDDERDSLTYYPTLCGLYTWNDEQPVMTHDDLNIEYDYNTQTWLSLGYDLLPNFMDAPDILGFDRFKFWTDITNGMLIPNYNNVGYISHPRLIATGGQVYLLYSAIIEQPLTCPGAIETFFRGVFLTVSRDNGATFNQKENTSWLSYHPNLFLCDWCDFYHTSDSTHNGLIEMIFASENGYPTMAPTVMYNTLVFTWLSDMFPFPESTWQKYPLSVVGFRLPIYEAGYYCNTQEICVPVWWWCFGVDEKTLIADLKVYPNPAEDIATIQINTSNPYTLTITNIMGQVVQTIQGQQPRVDLNVSNYPAGVYIVNVKTAHATASQKLIVK